MCQATAPSVFALMKARHAHGARERPALFQLASTCLASPYCWQCSGNAEGSIDHFDEVSFFAKNEPLSLRRREVLTSFRVGLQTCSVRLIRSQTVECDEGPGNIVGPFVGEKI